MTRFPLGVWPTPLHRVPRLNEALECPSILVKRDDLSGFGVAGNKTRALEYLVADALAAGADTLVTGGRPSSNFCAAAAAAASVAGLSCHLVLAASSSSWSSSWSSSSLSSSLSLVRLASAFGATVVPTTRSGSGIDDDIEAHAEALRADGFRPYPMPRGGSTAVGAQGFAEAAHELDGQLRAHGVEPAAVVCAVGSGGSYAGLLCGAAELGWPWPVVGASVSRPIEEMRSVVAALASSAAALRSGVCAAVDLVDALGPGHGLVDASQRALIATAARKAGLLLDPTYTAKALQVAVTVAQRARRPVVFWHTGGASAALSFLESSLPGSSSVGSSSGSALPGSVSPGSSSGGVW